MRQFLIVGAIVISIFSNSYALSDKELEYAKSRCFQYTNKNGYDYPFRASCKEQIDFIMNMETLYKDCRESKYYYSDLFKIYSNPFTCNNLNDTQIMKANPEKALYYLLNKLFKDYKDYYELGELYARGQNSWFNGMNKVEINLDKALNFFLKAYENFPTSFIKDSDYLIKEIGETLSYLGVIYYIKGDLQKAYEYLYLKSKKEYSWETPINKESQETYKKLCLDNPDICNKKPKIFLDDFLTHNEALKYFNQGKELKCYLSIGTFNVVSKDKKWKFIPALNKKGKNIFEKTVFYNNPNIPYVSSISSIWTDYCKIF